jgi:hypothetical protein
MNILVTARQARRARRLRAIPGQRERGMRGRASARIVARTGAATALGALGFTVAVAASTAAGPVAHSSRVLTVRDEGHLRFIHASGSTLLDEGRVSGSFPGTVKVRFLYNGEPNVGARFTITGAGGSISAIGSGRLSSPVNPTPSFKGHMQITGGSGRYAHVRGSGELFGVFNRRSYALSVQAIGKLPY